MYDIQRPDWTKALTSIVKITRANRNQNFRHSPRNLISYMHLTFFYIKFTVIQSASRRCRYVYESLMEIINEYLTNKSKAIHLHNHQWLLMFYNAQITISLFALNWNVNPHADFYSPRFCLEEGYHLIFIQFHHACWATAERSFSRYWSPNGVSPNELLMTEIMVDNYTGRFDTRLIITVGIVDSTIN